jgi:Lrp/AsnC family leucine-responsive transcriptional regulator
VKTTDLDDIDNRIVGALVRNSRVSYADLGGEVGLSPHATADRVKRLVRSGVITGFTATIDLGTVGRTLDAYIDVRLAPSVLPAQFDKAIEELPQVVEIAFVTGRFDYQLRVACRDVDDLDHVVRTLRGKAGAAHTETRIVMRSTVYRPAVG